MARPISPAIESTLIFETCLAAALSGIVLVTTTSVIGESTRFSTAGPESTGCEQQAYTVLAPFSISACATFTSVPAVSMRSSMMRQVRPLTSPITFITSAPFIHDGQRCVHFLCEEARAFHTTRVRRNHGQIGQIQLLEIIHQHR